MPITKQLLILGNGFDLHCDLKSSYKEFFKSEILNEYSVICGSAQMKDDCTGFWEGLLFQYYLTYSDIDYNWCDIEKIIMKTLWQICFGYSNINKGIWHTALNRINTGKIPVDEYIHNDILFDYLLRNCIKIFHNLSSKINLTSDISNLSLLLNELLYELYNFENRFCKYIKNLIVNPYDEQEILSEYLFKAINLLVKLTSNYKINNCCNLNIFIDIKNTMFLEEASELAKKCIYTESGYLTKELMCLKYTNILSFNYTNLFDILKTEPPCVYSNVHGKFCTNTCKDCTCSNIIFGIDDTDIQSQNEIPELRLFSKTYRKMQNLSSTINILPIIDNNQSLEIKFYGHSLSSADYSYFQSIFDYYNIYENSRVSLIFYYSKGYEQYNAIYDLINNYGNTLNNKDQGKNLMHKLLLENRLKIVEIE